MRARTMAGAGAGTRPVSVGLIGCGGIARLYHARALARSPGAELIALADPDGQARARARERHPVPAFAGLGELLAGAPVEAVVICAATGAHAELATQAICAGKHVYVEKPLAPTLGEAEQIIESARGAPVIAAVGFNFRFEPVFERARSLLREGVVGSVKRASSRLYEPVPPSRLPAWKRRRATGGGILLDLGSHQLDLARWLLDDEVASVAEADVSSRHSEHDAAGYLLTMRSGARLSGELSYRRGRVFDWYIEGEDGALVIDRHANRLRLAARRRVRRPGRARARLRALPVPRREPSFDRSLAAFCDAIRGQGNELPTLADGKASLAAVQELEAAAGVG